MDKTQIPKKYLYAIIDCAINAKFIVKGLEAASVYTIPYKDISAVVSDLGKVKADLNEDHIISHESVVEGLMGAFTVLPVRFFTLLNDENAILSMLESRYDDFINSLSWVKDKVELSVKVIWPTENIKSNIVDFNTYNLDDAQSSPGKRYMYEKTKNYAHSMKLNETADEYIKIIDNELSMYCSEKKLERLKTQKLLLSASYLVGKNNVGEFKAGFKYLQSELKELKFLFSGPWPAYSFVNISKKNRLPGRNLEENA